MNRWQERFDSHEIHKTLKELHSLGSKDIEVSEEEQIIEKRRFLKIIESFQSVLKKLDPEVISYHILDNITNQLRSDPLFSNLEAYIDQGKAQYIRQANDLLDDIVPLFCGLYQVSNLGEEIPTRGLEKIFDSFVKVINSEKEELKKELHKLNEQSNQQDRKLTDLSTDIDSRKKEINELIANWQAQFSDAQNTRQKEFTNTLDRYRNEVDGRLIKIQERSNKFTSEAVEKHNQILEKNQTQFDEKMSSYLNEAKEKHKAILELYELTAGDSVAAAYIKSANNEGKAADFWRWATIVFVIATSIWTGIAYYLGSIDVEGNILWGQILKAFSITGVLLFGAVYSAKQSNAHRINERQTRWFALEVKAIDPFISSLPPTEQSSLKNKLSEKLFGQSSRANDKDFLHNDEHYLETLLNGIANIIKAKQ